MGVKEYSIYLDQNTKKKRLGCSVCKKKINNDNSIENVSSKPWIEKRYLKNNVLDKKLKNCELSNLSPTKIPRHKIKECYCNHMEQVQIESFPRLICSKRFKTPHLTDIDEKWFNEIIEFRRQNWFDCHAESFIDSTYVQNINPLNIFNKHKPNCNHQNTISLISTDDTELITEHPFIYLEDTTRVQKHLNVQKKSTVSKFDGKKKKDPNPVYKPWIPPSSSVHYKC